MAKPSTPPVKSTTPAKPETGFWAWYERHYVVTLTITAALFALQLVHLYWLTADVVMSKLVGQSYFQLTPFWQYIIVLVDYTEIPSLLSTSLLYIYQLRKGWSWKSILFLILLNSQWLHLFWITDEFVVNKFQGESDMLLPAWLAWVAILIDYLELPVIADTIMSSIKAIKEGRYRDVLKEGDE
jgi:hypothetical protein